MTDSKENILIIGDGLKSTQTRKTDKPAIKLIEVKGDVGTFKSLYQVKTFKLTQKAMMNSCWVKVEPNKEGIR